MKNGETGDGWNGPRFTNDAIDGLRLNLKAANFDRPANSEA